VSADDLRLRKLFRWNDGSYGYPSAYVTCGDFDRDGLQDLTFWTGTIYPDDPPRWEIWECREFNRYSLVYADTAPYPYPPGILTGTFWPHATGDLDGDSLVELWGLMREQLSGEYDYRLLLVCLEGASPGDYPTDMVWYERIDSSNQAQSHPMCLGDFDRDGRQEIVFLDNYLQGDHPMAVYENKGGNSYVYTWFTDSNVTYDVATGDLDSDGRTDFVAPALRPRVFECRGDNRYDAVYHAPTYPRVDEVWIGHDVNGNGKPEFYGTDHIYLPNEDFRFYLYFWESDADDHYVHTLVDSADRSVHMTHNQSTCGDIDADGAEEVIWATSKYIQVYKGGPPGVFTEVCEQYAWHGPMDQIGVTIHDMNRNGYNDIVIGGSGMNTIYEIDAVQVLRPVGGEVFHAGDTCRVVWRTFDPPPCDSVSLFLRRDSTYALDTIVTGLAPADTPYVWVVPDIQAESCWVMAIAYGPGWQYDECDRPIAILGAGVEEEHVRGSYTLGLSVRPNPVPGRATVVYEVPRSGRADVAVFDRSGRAVARLLAGAVEPGRYHLSWDCRDTGVRRLAAGVYFMRLDFDGERRMQKVVVTQ